jgi:hypothetical protein
MNESMLLVAIPGHPHTTLVTNSSGRTACIVVSFPRSGQLGDAQQPRLKKQIEARRKAANRAAQGDDDHYHTVANPAKSEKPGERGAGPPKPTGYRPGRKTQQRREENGSGSAPRP